MLLFLLGPGAVLVSPAADRWCQSEGVWEGPSEQSPEAVLNQGQGEKVRLPGLCSAALWGRGLVQEGEGADSSGQFLAPHATSGALPDQPWPGNHLRRFWKVFMPGSHLLPIGLGWDLIMSSSSPQPHSAPGTGFTEDSFSTGRGRAGGWFQDDSSALHLLCTLFLLLLYQLHLRSSGIRSQRLETPDVIGIVKKLPY